MKGLVSAVLTVLPGEDGDLTLPRPTLGTGEDLGHKVQLQNNLLCSQKLRIYSEIDIK